MDGFWAFFAPFPKPTTGHFIGSTPVYKGKKLFASELFCPHCYVIQPYHLKPMSKEIAFHPIFILETKEPPHVVECQICKNAFDPEVLARNIQGIFKLACSAKDQLEKGTFPGYLKLQLNE